MSYTLIILFGLAVVILLLGQLRNEERVQRQQIKKLFGNLAIKVSCLSQNTEDIFERPLSKKPRVLCPIISTSITCGREDKNGSYQLDLPIPTGDKDLTGTAVEILIEPDRDCLLLYVRLLEQPFMWVKKASEDGSYCYADARITSNEDMASLKLPPVPSILKSSTAERNQVEVYKKSDKVRLCIGDSILIGNTLLEITYDREGAL